MKDILIITSYYPPETGAASNRIYHLAEGLRDRQFKVSVVTPLPNYPTGKVFKSYRGKFKETTDEGGVRVHRLWIYASNSTNKFLRLLAMLSYSLSLLWYFILHDLPKTVIVQSPPLLVAFTCCTFLRSKKRRLILNVSDLWPRAGLELGALKKNFSYSLLERMEQSNYKKADVILGQSEEILTHVSSLVPNKPMFLYRNFPDFDAPIPNAVSKPSAKIRMVYAGLLGVAQGVLKLCHELDYKTVEFHIYGAGAERGQIEAYLKAHPELPITYHGELSRDALHNALLNYDLGIIPLLHRIYGSVPSKLFEYAKLGLPMLYFGGGEGETLMKDHQLGWVARAGDYHHLNTILSELASSDFNASYKAKIQETATRHFDFNTQLDALAPQL